MILLKKLKKKKILLYLFLFFFVFFISFIITYVCMPLMCDDVWLFGFSYNISKGLVIYRDFNVVTTPLYYFVVNLFIKIFGDYIIVVGIFNSIIVALMFLMMYRTIKLKAFIVLPLILIFYPNGYNLFSLFWLMIILFFIARKKDNDVLIGIILGLLFITKQNIGVSLLIPYLFYSRKRIKGMISFFLPFVLISVYLIFNDAFYQFIDYCFLGLFDFGAGNLYFDVFAIIELFVLVYLIFKLIKSRFKDKEVFYILMFQVIMYPLADVYHFFVAFFPVMYYFINDKRNFYFLIILAFAVFYFTFYLFFSVEHEIHTENDILFLKNSGDLSILMDNFHEYLANVDNYYFTGYYGYLYKLYYDIPITEYDLWNGGNMGYKGFEKRIQMIDEICSNNECLFIVDGDLERNPKSQVTKFYNYIIKKYDKIDEYNTFDIYSNKYYQKK